MKRNEWMALIATSFLMFAICLSATVQTNKKTEHKKNKDILCINAEHVLV